MPLRPGGKRATLCYAGAKNRQGNALYSLQIRNAAFRQGAGGGDYKNRDATHRQGTPTFGTHGPDSSVGHYRLLDGPAKRPKSYC